jgi:hypothetical protein
MIIVLGRRRYLPACNSLLKVFYQDGIFYFIGLTSACHPSMIHLRTVRLICLVLSVFNIIVFLVAPVGRAIHFAVPNIYWRNVFQNNGMKLLTIQ